jgi:hypothetical protein
MLVASMAVTALVAASAYADGGAAWHLAPAQPPAPPAGLPPAPYPLPVGQVGEISFWAPNRGLLITGGTEHEYAGPVPAGLYAYDGVEWHQLSTVCGGATGRIVWAGPDEFWTIADQRGGQQLGGSRAGYDEFRSISLCHFLNGEVVGSYAMPLEQTDSYLPMDAGACYTPDNCWFAGEYGANGSENGSFHLHWNGGAVTAIYEPGGSAVGDMVNFKGLVYESIQVGGGEEKECRPDNGWNVCHPPPVPFHTILAEGSGSLFSPLQIFINSQPRSLPRYPAGVAPSSLPPFSFGIDGLAGWQGETQLWAVTGPTSNENIGLPVIVLRYGEDPSLNEYVWSQTATLPTTGGAQLWGMTLAGAEAVVAGVPGEAQGAGEVIAPEPGSGEAWLSLRRLKGEGPEGAIVQRLGADGTLGPQEVLPVSGEAVGYRGEAGPIVCPAPRDCWMATTGGKDPVTNERIPPGWLFHLTDGTQYPRDTDPNFSGLITNRPPDDGVPVIYPDAPPADDSLANEQPPPAPNGLPLQILTPTPRKAKAKPLLAHVHTRLVGHRVLVLSFNLSVRAHVQLIARRGRAVVARTRARWLRPGRHTLSLSLDPARWPTGFQFKATPAGASTAGGSEESGAGDTLST